MMALVRRISEVISESFIVGRGAALPQYEGGSIKIWCIEVKQVLYVDLSTSNNPHCGEQASSRAISSRHLQQLYADVWIGGHPSDVILLRLGLLVSYSASSCFC